MALSAVESPDDWDYLFTDVYREVDSTGWFAPSETPAEESARLAAVAAESGRYLFALMEQGEVLESFASAGRLAAFHEYVFDLRRDELLNDFSRRSYVAAARAGQLHVCEYMVRRGFPVMRACPALAIDFVDASVDGGDEDGVPPRFLLSPAHLAAGHMAEQLIEACHALEASILGGGREATALELDPRALPAPLDVTLLFLARRGVLDANTMRTHDGFTALHLAALHGSCEVSAALVVAGADVNAVAIEGETPLYCAHEALRESRGEGGDAPRVEKCEATIAVLVAAGARLSWGATAASEPAVKPSLLSDKRTEAAPGGVADPAGRVTVGTSSLISVVVSTPSDADFTDRVPSAPQARTTHTSSGAPSEREAAVTSTFMAPPSVASAANCDAERARSRAERLAGAVSATGGHGMVVVRKEESAGPGSDAAGHT